MVRGQVDGTKLFRDSNRFCTDSNINVVYCTIIGTIKYYIMNMD